MRDTTESAESLAEEFLLKFNKLSKWEQVNLSAIIDIDGFEEAFIHIDGELND